MKKEDRKALFDVTTPRVAIDLVTLSYQTNRAAKNPETVSINLCKNSEDIYVDGVLYKACGMEVTKPNKTMESGETSGNLRLSGIGNTYIQLIQELAPDTAISMESKTIFADNPQEVLDGPYILQVDQIAMQSSTGTIEISCSGGDMLDYIASTWNYTSKNFPAIWT